jgi:hypothetical protein
MADLPAVEVFTLNFEPICLGCQVTNPLIRVFANQHRFWVINLSIGNIHNA